VSEQEFSVPLDTANRSLWRHISCSGIQNQTHNQKTQLARRQTGDSSQTLTSSSAIAERQCCGLGQFWPNETGGRYMADIIGLSSTTVT